jgi:hypothetical protein
MKIKVATQVFYPKEIPEETSYPFILKIRNAIAHVATSNMISSSLCNQKLQNGYSKLTGL